MKETINHFGGKFWSEGGKMAELTVQQDRYRESTRCGILPATITLSIREPGSALTHFAALIMMAMGAGPLLSRALRYGSVYTTAGMMIFIVSTCLLYSASTVYHTIVAGLRVTTFFRKLDHCSISVMIAGTYTPVCLTVLRGRTGYALLASIWGLAVIGVVMKLFWITCPKWMSSVLYIAMGWLCVFAMKPLLEVLSSAEFLWLLAGGIFYTVGAGIYAMHPKKFDAKHIYFGSHEIFHVFIMMGTFCHYMVMYSYLVFSK